MVRRSGFCVDFALISAPVIRAKDMVDPDTHPITAVGEPQSVATASVTISQDIIDDMMRIRDRRVVEITAEQHAHTLMLPEESDDLCHLSGPLHSSP